MDNQYNQHSKSDKNSKQKNDEEVINLTKLTNLSNGLLTSIWGGNTWESLHCITFAYPDEPTEEDKQHYKTYFLILKYILPCCTCRKHYTEHTAVGGKYEINDDVFESRNSLTLWLFNLHNCVDESLGMQYDITYDDLCKKYNSYVANCEMTIDKKIIAYKNYYNKEAPYLSFEMAICFKNYAESRGMIDFAFNLLNTYKKFITKRNDKGDISSEWIERNSICWEQVKHMKINGIIGFEQSGEHKNLPTIEELKMIQMMSTTLSLKSLNHMIEKLKNN